MKLVVRILLALGVVVAGVGLYVLGARLHAYGEHEGAGTPLDKHLPEAVVRARARAEQRAAAALTTTPPARQVLFGDLHVHTTFSTDAFLWSLPMAGGEGAHPVSDACDFARFCSGLDFWSINDHAEATTPRRWQETREAIRECNAVAGDPENPDVVAFLGWEWSQVGITPEQHYGHKNVILRDLDDAQVPSRVIGAAGPATDALRGRSAACPGTSRSSISRTASATSTSSSSWTRCARCRPVRRAYPRRTCPPTATNPPPRRRISSASSTSGGWTRS